MDAWLTWYNGFGDNQLTNPRITGWSGGHLNVSADLIFSPNNIIGWGGTSLTPDNQCSDGSTPIIYMPPAQPVSPQQLVPYVLPYLQSHPNAAPPLLQQEIQNGYRPPVTITTSSPPEVSLPPQVTTQTNPDGSKDITTTTTTDKISVPYPDVNIGRSTTTSTQYTPAPTTANPNPSPVASGPTTTSSSPMPSGSNPTPQQFVPPDASVPNVPPVPPGVIQLPLPNIDNSGGTCPPPIVMNVGLPGLQTITMDLTPLCTLAGYLHPLVLTAGALAAMFILVK